MPQKVIDITSQADWKMLTILCTAKPRTEQELRAQAVLTAAVYLDCAVDSIDRKLGTGSAYDNPSLVAALVHASTVDFAVHSIVNIFQEAKDA